MKNSVRFFVLFLAFFAGCKKESCFGEAGDVITATRAATAFHQIDIYDAIDVILTQDTVERITITAPQHLEPNITAHIEDGVLSLRNQTACTWLRNAAEKITVYVHLKKLDRIVYAGSGNVRSTNTLIADNMTFYSGEGAGNLDIKLQAVQTFSYIMDENADFTLHGTSDFCYSYTNSRGTINFSDFVVKKMNIEYGSVRNATVHVTETLNAILYYKGNLFYKGSPAVTKNEVHSSGRLIHTP